jgi:hypothetical protein
MAERPSPQPFRVLMSVDFRACDEKTAQEMRALLDRAVRRTISTEPETVGVRSTLIRRRLTERR